MKFHWILGLFLSFLPSGFALAGPRVLKAASFEMCPYISREEPSGYFKELALAIFREMGHDLDVDFFPYLRAPRMLEEKSYDVLLPAFLDENKNESKNLAYSDPILETNFGTINMNGDSHRNSTDEKNLSNEERLREQLSPDMILRQLDTLNSGRTDEIYLEKYLAAETVVNQRPALVQKLNFIRDPAHQLQFRVAFRKSMPGYEAILDAFNKTFRRLKNEGKVDEILNQLGYYDQNTEEGSLNIAAVANSDFELLKELAPIFQRKHPKVKIRWNLTTHANLRRRILRSLTFNNNVYDIVSLLSYDAPIFASHGWLETLPKPDSNWNEKDILPDVKSNFIYKGDYIALPFASEVSASFYRKDLFRAKKLVWPEKPTYADIESFAKALHDPKHGVYGVCMLGKLGGGENLSHIISMAMTGGGRILDETWKVDLNSKAWVDALKTYLRLVKNYGPPRLETLDPEKNRELFAQGKCAMWFDTTSALSRLRDPEQSQVLGKFAVGNAPYMRKDLGGWYWLWSLGVPRNSKNKALAEEFIRWASSVDYGREVANAKDWSHVPSGFRLSTYKNPQYRKAEPYADYMTQKMQLFRVPLKAMPTTGPDMLFFFEIWPAIGNYLGQMIQDVLTEKQTPEEALNLSQTYAMRVMYQSGFYKPGNHKPKSGAN